MVGGLVTTLLLTTMSVSITVCPSLRLVMKYVNVEYSVFTTWLAPLCKTWFAVVDQRLWLGAVSQDSLVCKDTRLG